MKEFNEVGENLTNQTQFPKRINFEELLMAYEYGISKVLYVSTPIHEKSVVLRIIDEAGEERSMFAPKKGMQTNFATTMRRLKKSNVTSCF